VALALVLVLPSGFSGGPSVADAAALAQKPATQPAPGAAPSAPALLREEVDDVPFPNYAAKFGWKPAGARQDDPSGRGATTVYYERGGRTIGHPMNPRLGATDQTRGPLALAGCGDKVGGPPGDRGSDGSSSSVARTLTAMEARRLAEIRC